jgi:hypothetical protein
MIKKIQKVVRTDYGLQPMELEKALSDGWTVAYVNPFGGGYTLEYILEKDNAEVKPFPGNLGNSETVKNPEE